MREDKGIFQNIDWITVLLYFALVLIGWLSIYSTNYDVESGRTIFDLSINSGKQFLRIISCLIIIVVIFSIDFQTFESLGYIFYGILILLLISVLIFGREVAGSKSWFELGFIKIQPSEFAKYGTALALAKFMSVVNFKFDQLRNVSGMGLIIGLPMILIILQGDTGTALVFSAFAIPLYREGLNPLLIILGLSMAAIFILTLFVSKIILGISIAALVLAIIFFIKKNVKNILLTIASGALVFSVIFGVDYLVTNVLKPHQQNRIKALIDPDSDPRGYGYNVINSKTAIGSGGFSGKGYLEGYYTQLDFVPEQTTDFIFCTIGEESGWIGSFVLIGIFVFLLVRIVNIAERQKSKFARIYGYSVAGIFFFHFLVNIGMTIGYFPVIGIPLPFISYGGSSLWAFTILLFTLLKLDAHRMQILVH